MFARLRSWLFRDIIAAHSVVTTNEDGPPVVMTNEDGPASPRKKARPVPREIYAEVEFRFPLPPICLHNKEKPCDVCMAAAELVKREPDIAKDYFFASLSERLDPNSSAEDELTNCTEITRAVSAREYRDTVNGLEQQCSSLYEFMMEREKARLAIKLAQEKAMHVVEMERAKKDAPELLELARRSWALKARIEERTHQFECGGAGALKRYLFKPEYRDTTQNTVYSIPYREAHKIILDAHRTKCRRAPERRAPEHLEDESLWPLNVQCELYLLTFELEERAANLVKMRALMRETCSEKVHGVGEAFCVATDTWQREKRERIVLLENWWQAEWKKRCDEHHRRQSMVLAVARGDRIQVQDLIRVGTDPNTMWSLDWGEAYWRDDIRPEDTPYPFMPEHIEYIAYRDGEQVVPKELLGFSVLAIAARLNQNGDCIGELVASGAHIDVAWTEDLNQRERMKGERRYNEDWEQFGEFFHESFSPLHFAVNAENEGTVRALIDAGADVNKLAQLREDQPDEWSLHEWRQQNPLWGFSKENRGRPEGPDDKDLPIRTPLDMARELNHTAICSMLESAGGKSSSAFPAEVEALRNALREDFRKEEVLINY
ncbi:hypothetical protein RI054_21g93100 [Pseudoscourfieldia marina]